MWSSWLSNFSLVYCWKQLYNMQDLRLSQWFCWHLRFSSMWCCVWVSGSWHFEGSSWTHRLLKVKALRPFEMLGGTSDTASQLWRPESSVLKLLLIFLRFYLKNRRRNYCCYVHICKRKTGVFVCRWMNYCFGIRIVITGVILSTVQENDMFFYTNHGMSLKKNKYQIVVHLLVLTGSE
jgi:hypothetical protein